MRKRYLLPVGLFLALWLTAVWLVGWYAQRSIEQGLEHFNARISTVLSSDLSQADAHVSIERYERGWMASSIRYQITLTDRHGKQEHFFLNDVLEHGPFPWSMVREADFRPVLARSSARLETTPAMQAWLAPEAGTDTPLRLESEIGFAGRGHTIMHFAPLSSPAGSPQEIAFSGGKVQLDVSDQFRASKLQGYFDTWRQSERHSDEVVTLSGIDIQAQTRQLAADNSFEHHNQMHVTLLEAGDEKEASILQMHNIRTALGISQQGGLMDIGLQYHVDRLAVNEADAGQVTLEMAVNQLDREALSTLQARWLEYAENASKRGLLRLTDEARSELAQALRQVLKHGPQWRLDPLVWKNQAGESHASVTVTLHDAFTVDTRPDDWLLQSIQQADMELSLNRAMVVELFSQLSADEANGASQGARLGEELFDSYAESLGRLGLVTRQGDDARLAISVKPGENHVLLNDSEITMEQLMLLGVGLFLQF